jgi:hypothetical protein
MHNGYKPGSGDVTFLFEGVAGELIPHRGETAVTVAGHEGTYRRFIKSGGWMNGLPAEEWMVDIQGTTVTITLAEGPKALEAELTEAHEIIDSSPCSCVKVVHPRMSANREVRTWASVPPPRSLAPGHGPCAMMNCRDGCATGDGTTDGTPGFSSGTVRSTCWPI